MMPDTFVIVRRQPNNYMTAKYLLSSFEDPHWDTVSGGVQTTMFNKPFIYGYVQCTGAVEGEVAHSGVHGSCPHRIKVCALKKDNSEIYSTLLELAGSKPTEPLISTRISRSSILKHRSLYTYKERILSFLCEEGKSEDTIIEHMIRKPWFDDYKIRGIKAILTKLTKEGQIICDKDPKDRRNNIYRVNPDY